MGFFKKLLGLEKDDEKDDGGEGEMSERGAGDERGASGSLAGKIDRDRADRLGGRDKRGRPPLADTPPPSQSIDDALVLREAGDKAAARKMLAEIDRGGGLRTVLRAATALEDGDEDLLAKLLPAVAGESGGWKLLLQTAAALDDLAIAAPLVDRAEKGGAPAWAIAWTRAIATDEATRRRGLVDLLFADAPLARTVAARDLKLPGAVADAEAGARYAAFAHGRDSIRRFGAASVAKTIERARAIGGA